MPSAKTNSKNKKAANIDRHDANHLIEAYKEMVCARKLDEKAILLYKQNKCFFQIGCAGHEAIQLAAAHSLRSGYDWFHPYYRDLAFCLSIGMTDKEFMLNAMNKAADPNSGGRQMPMHFGHAKLNIVSQSSPTGTQYLHAIGSAMAIKYVGSDAVVYVSSGEGTTSEGAYHEALNFAARNKLPVIFCIQNNKFAISVPISEQTAGCSIAKISSGFEGLDVVEVDGVDYLESLLACKNAVARARSGGGPTVIVADVVRLQSHSISDNQLKYRSIESLEEDKKRDPVKLLGELLVAQKIVASTKDLDKIQQEIQSKVDEAAKWAEQQAEPLPASCTEHVYAIDDTTICQLGSDEQQASGPESFIVDALNHALDEELSLNPNMLMFGQDIADPKGGVFGVTAGLSTKYGKKRVFNAPLAESLIAGTALGMAVSGLRPVIEIQFADFAWAAMMQIRNEIALIHYRSNGAFSCPLVIRIPVGGYIHGGIYHSQNIEATFSHYPGLYVVYPSNATDAKGLLKTCMRSKNPVLFLEHKGLYRQVYAKGREGGINDCIPLGRAKILRQGSDLSVVTWGALVQKSLIAAEKLSKEGLNIEVIDIRSILPLDTETILTSVKKTGRVLVAHEDSLFMGFGAEIAALLADKAFKYLDAPIRRLGGENTPIPHSPVLESEVLPQTEDCIRAMREILKY